MSHNHYDKNNIHTQSKDTNMHPMTFHFGSSETILFDSWKIDSVFGIFTSCLVIIFLCFLLEFVRWFRLYRKKQKNLGEINSLTDNNSSCQNIMFILCDGGFHAIQLTLSYFLMLIFMTFNVWLCFAVIFGEVIARIIYTFMFPKLENLNNTFLATETCCG